MMAPLELSTVAPARPRIDALSALLPRIETERLVLRAPRLDDWPVLAPIWTTARAKHIGGPFSAEDAWLDFCQMVAGWLLRGFGCLTIASRADGTVLGAVLLSHELGDPEPELGWLLTEEAEGRGYATEAARAMRAEGLRLFGPGGFVSYVERDNARSIRVAERLGAACDAAPHPAADDVLVFRHGTGDEQ